MNQELRIKERNCLNYIVNVFVIFSLASCFLLLASCSNAQATAPQQTISVSPIINDLQLTPGKKTTFKLTVRNNNDSPVGIHAETTGYDVMGETPVLQQKQSVMINWTSLSRTDLLLGEHDSKSITVTIDTPKNTKQSGYYETIFLTPIYHQQQKANSPIILSRIGVLVLGTVGKPNYNDLAKKVSVTGLTPSVQILNSFPSTFSFTVANKYFTHFDAKPFITLTPLFAKSQTAQLSDKHVLPGSARDWQYQLPAIPNHIFYQVHLAVSVGGGKQVYANTFFIVLPYEKIVLLLLVLILLYIGLFKRHRILKAVEILVNG
jgi:hypothetical protein